MTRHITDSSHHASGNGRLTHYTALDRSQSRNRVWDQIDRSRKGVKDASRVRQFLRIARELNG